ncbi:hypothetical protein BD779DRAFT_1499579 [Infundibulicybe gibba]|nr:hypothetical protein BD779DRAFT_1499579 [Infundibulicybe gibba]
MDIEPDYVESDSVTFEWTLRGLKHLFESTKGEAKSKVTKSVRFGRGRWQEGSTDAVSLYLSCEPTPEEKEDALSDSGRWVRDGKYKFSFEIRSLSKAALCNPKEAHNHSFSHKTANWGWAQFARRDSVYFQSGSVKAQDAFVITCTITASPAPPPPLPSSPRHAVPKELLNTFGSLLDDPIYSDVEFVIPKHAQGLKHARRIFASRKILKRAEYFESMFNSNFAEGSSDGLTLTPKLRTRPPSVVGSEPESIMDRFEDSDDDDDDADEVIEGDKMMDDSCDSSQSSPILGSCESASLVDPVTDEKIAHPSNIQAFSLPPRGPPANKYLTVVVKDLYTNSIVFAPLSSSYTALRRRSPNNAAISLPTSNEPQGHTNPRLRTRQEWIKEWQPAYRLADRLDLGDLKERASQHIFKSLTVDNIAYEVFSPFAATFDEIRKVQVNFFLTHWEDIRNSESMRDVWRQIRNGRHSGFEEVWPVIAQSLEFKPTNHTSE